MKGYSQPIDISNLRIFVDYMSVNWSTEELWLSSRAWVHSDAKTKPINTIPNYGWATYEALGIDRTDLHVGKPRELPKDSLEYENALFLILSLFL